MATKNIRQFYNPDEKCLFVGNGPNQLAAYFSWDDLLRNLYNVVGLSAVRRQKSFP